MRQSSMKSLKHLSRQGHTFHGQEGINCWHTHWPLRLRQCLHWWHNGANPQSFRNMQRGSSQSSNSTCNQGSSPPQRYQQTNSTGTNGGQGKLEAEGGLAETKVILGWHFNFQTLSVTLLEHKHIAWLTEICKMLTNGRTSKKALESTIGWLGHVGFIVPWVYHFLSRLQTWLAQARNKRTIQIDNACRSNSELMLQVLDKEKGGIDMNLLAFCAPDQIYYSDSCPVGLGGYSNQGFAWQYCISFGRQIICWNI